MEPIYIQIAQSHNNKMFKFIAEECFATPTSNPNDLTKYLFFEGKCKLDSTFKEYNKNTPSKFSFSIDAFKFIAYVCIHPYVG